MARLTMISTGLIYRNPIPHVYSKHAVHPGVVQLENGELLATMTIGQAFESVDGKVYLARSLDNGENWKLEHKLYEGSSYYPSSEGGRISCLEDGEVVVYLNSANRKRLEMGLCNPDNMGFAETEFLLMRSSDGGRTWTEPVRMVPPIVGPSFEICCPISELSDGRWILPTQTWMGWDGHCPNGFRMVAFVSYDRGKTWPDYWDVMHDANDEFVYWEGKILELPDKRLLAAAWAYNRARNYDLPNPYTISSDGGKTFSAPMSTNLHGQTMTPFLLADGTILTVYRRMDKPGLWANLSTLDGEGVWRNEEELALWGVDRTGLVATGDNMSHNFHALKFGAPSIIQLQDRTIFIAFWCMEDFVYNIRWIKLHIQ